jgi:hypothetical protein
MWFRKGTSGGALVNMAMNLWGPEDVGKFLRSWVTCGLPRTQLHGVGSFQTLSAISKIHMLLAARNTCHHEAHSLEMVNKVKNSLYACPFLFGQRETATQKNISVPSVDKMEYRYNLNANFKMSQTWYICLERVLIMTWPLLVDISFSRIPRTLSWFTLFLLSTP